MDFAEFKALARAYIDAVTRLHSQLKRERDRPSIREANLYQTASSAFARIEHLMRRLPEGDRVFVEAISSGGANAIPTAITKMNLVIRRLERLSQAHPGVDLEAIVGPDEPGGITRAMTREGTEAISVVDDPRAVFVIHGRDETIRSSMFSFLRAIGLRPLEWSGLVCSTGQGSPYIGDVLATAFERAQAIVALHTPDDFAYLRPDLRVVGEAPHETEPTGQARPNVLFEAGMSMGRNPDRTVIVEVGKMRPYSDISGRHVVRLTNEPAKRKDLAHRLEACGCAVDLSGDDWLTVGNFTVTNEPPTEVAPISSPDDLSKESRELLLQAASGDGTVLMTQTSSGFHVQTGGRQLVPDQTPRTVAAWRNAVKELVSREYLEPRGMKGEVFELTTAGFEAADRSR